MKKVVLSTLLLAAVALSASAETYVGNNGVSYSGPNKNAPYRCYYTNYNGTAVDGGISYWTLFTYQDASGRPMPRGTEYFQSTHVPWDGFKATWSAPRNIQEPGVPLNMTRWDYTFNPYGPQCTQADVHYNGIVLTFNNCSDGHSRSCYLQQ